MPAADPDRRHRALVRAAPVAALAGLLLACVLVARLGALVASDPDPAPGPPAAALPAGAAGAAGATGTAGAATRTAPVPAGPVGEDTLELMRLSGLDARAGRFARDAVDALAAGFAAADPDGSPGRARRAAVAGARAFPAARVREAVARRVEAALDAPTRAHLIGHHRSALGRRALAAERTRDARDDPDALERFARAAREGEGFEDRLARLASLVAETGRDELALVRAGELARAVLHAGLVADPAGRGPELDRRLDELEWRRDTSRLVLARELPTLLAHTYAELADEDLEALLERSRGGERRRLLEAFGAGLGDATRAGLEDFAARYREARQSSSSSAAAGGAEAASARSRS